MNSQVSIVNSALSNLGQGPIADMNDASATGAEASRLARLRWDSLLDAVLTELTWNFATTRATASAQAVAPLWGYTYAIPVPADYIRVVEVQGDDSAPWEIEDVNGVTCIVTDIGNPIFFRYIRRVTNPQRWSAAFVEAFAARLSVELAEPITRDQAIVQNMTQLYNSKIKLARQVDSQERTPPVIDASTWTRARSNSSAQLARLSGGTQPLGYP